MEPRPEPVLLALQRATHATLHVLATTLASLELTASEINALAALADGPAPTVSGLAAATGTRATTLTSVLDRLERRGHVARVPRPGDRRAVLIQLTPAGHRAATSVRQAMAGLEQRALGGLPAGTIDAARTVLRALTEVSP